MENDEILKKNEIIVLRHLKDNPFEGCYRINNKTKLSLGSIFDALKSIKEKGCINDFNQVTSKGEEEIVKYDTVKIKNLEYGVPFKIHQEELHYVPLVTNQGTVAVVVPQRNGVKIVSFDGNLRVYKGYGTIPLPFSNDGQFSFEGKCIL